jgi:sulfate adenylyltransferase
MSQRPRIAEDGSFGSQGDHSLITDDKTAAWPTLPVARSSIKQTCIVPSVLGVTVFFTGLPGAGKSTLADALLLKFANVDRKRVNLLDGDIVRKQFSPELGFSKQDRDANIRRIGLAASEITKNGGIAVCAAIAPYDHTRKEVRAMIELVGGFVLIYLSTPLAVCEERDRKGLYAKARAGEITKFTGISDPYEVPTDSEMTIDASSVRPEAAAQDIVMYLSRHGFVV